MKVKTKLISRLSFVAVNYVIGPILGISICLLEACGRIKFIHFERFPIWESKLIMVSNHPSLLEPVILPLAGFPWMNFPWLFSPVWTRIKLTLSWFKELEKEFALSQKLIPANLPDKNNFYDPTYLGIFRGINVPVNRNGHVRDRITTVLALKKILDNDGRVLIFPEGSRTFKAIRKSGMISEDGHKLGKLKDGAAWLALKTNARILPIWVDGTDKVLPNNRFPIPRLWHRVVIKVGAPFSVLGLTRQEASLEVARALLKLADERSK